MTRIIKWVSLSLLLSAAFVPTARANTYTAATCGESDVNTAIGMTSNGDTVIIPAGTCTWTSALPAITTAITLMGEGTGTTTIIDDYVRPCTGAGLITVSVSGNLSWRITAFTIQSESGTSASCGDAHIAIGGGSHSFRIDHMNIGTDTGAQDERGVTTSGDLWGVIDHNTFGGRDITGVFITHDAWQGVGHYGDNSWAQPDTMGTAEAVYIENNSFTDPAPIGAGCFDSNAGGRYVFRFNNCSFTANHGLESSGRTRSVRQYEIYDNTFTAFEADEYTGMFLRGGTGPIFNNAFVATGGNSYTTLVKVNNYRDTSGYAPWGPSDSAEECDGRSPFDTNSGTTYATFTASGSSSTDSTVATTSPWSTNQWAPTSSIQYSLVDITGAWGSTILSNTANTIVTSTQAQGGKGNAHLASSGDSMEILAAYPCADQIGRGYGLLVQDSSGTNGIPVLNSTGNPGPVNEASDPMYEWLNTYNSTTEAAITVNNSPHLVQNRDFYDWTASFAGASGVGTGTLADIPSTCTVGTAYWATDQGNWNQSGSGGQGVLYTCTATNTWTATYTPYTYPHPLTLAQSAGNPPAPPTALTATVN